MSSTPYSERKSGLGGLMELTKSRKGWAFILSLLINALYVVLYAFGHQLPYEAFGVASAGAFALIGGQSWADASEASDFTKKAVDVVVREGLGALENSRKELG